MFDPFRSPEERFKEVFKGEEPAEYQLYLLAKRATDTADKDEQTELRLVLASQVHVAREHRGIPYPDTPDKLLEYFEREHVQFPA